MQGNGHGVVASKMASGMLVPMSLEQVKGLLEGRVKHEGKNNSNVVAAIMLQCDLGVLELVP